MWKDPIVEEIQRHREEYAARFNYDLNAICRDLHDREMKSGAKLVSLPPRPVPKKFRKKGKPAA